LPSWRSDSTMGLKRWVRIVQCKMSMKEGRMG
jgi:hypothetical protein